MAEQNNDTRLRRLYDMIKSSGMKNMPEYDEFNTIMQDDNKRQKVYDRLKKKGMRNLPDYDKFSSSLGLSVTAIPQTQTQEADSTTTAIENTAATTEGVSQQQPQNPNDSIVSQLPPTNNTEQAGDSTAVAANDSVAPVAQKVDEPAQTETMQATETIQTEQPAQTETAQQSTEDLDGNSETASLPGYGSDIPNSIEAMNRQVIDRYIANENEKQDILLKRENLIANRAVLDKSLEQFDEESKSFEGEIKAFGEKYPEDWQPKTQAEYDQWKNDRDVILAKQNLLNAKRDALNSEIDRQDKDYMDIISSAEKTINNPAYMAQSLEGSVTEMLESVQREIALSKNGFKEAIGYTNPRGGYSALGANLSRTIGGESLRSKKQQDQSKYSIAERILQRAKNHIDEANAERRDEYVTNQWGSKAGWLGTVAGNVADYMKGYFRGEADAIKDGAGFDFGLKDLGEMTYLMKAIEKSDQLDAIAKKKSEGKALSSEEQRVFTEGLSDADRSILDAAAMEVAATAMFKTGMGYTGGQVGVQMIPFALEIAINPLAAIGKSAGSGVVRYALKKYGVKAAKKQVLRALATTARVGTDLALAGPGMALTTGAGNTFSEVMRRKNGNISYDIDESGNFIYGGHEDGMSIGKAISTGIASTSLEYSSENFSEWTRGFTKAVGLNKGAGKFVMNIMRGFAKMDDNEIGNMLRNFKKYGHIGNVFEEYTEEFVNNVGNGIIEAISNGQNNFHTGEGGVFNLYDNVETFLAVTMPQVFQKIIGLGVGGSLRSMQRHEYNQRNRQAAQANIDIFGADQWEAIRKNLDEAEGVESLTMRVVSLLDDKKLTSEQKKGILDYAQTLMASRAELVAENKVTEYYYNNDPDYIELGNRTNVDSGWIQSATTKNGDVVYIKSGEEGGETFVVYNPVTGETIQLSASELEEIGTKLDANGEADKIENAREEAKNMKLGDRVNINGSIYEVVDFSPETKMPIVDIYDTSGNVTTREMTNEEVMAATQQQAEVANMTVSEKLRKAMEEGNQQLYNQAAEELKDSILLTSSLKDLENIEAELKKVVPDLGGFKSMIDLHRMAIMRIRLSEINSASTKEELAQIEHSIGDDDTINNDFKKAIAKRYAELEKEAEQKSKKALDNVKALIDSTVDPAALDSIVLDEALSDIDRQVAQNLIEKKRRELAEDAAKKNTETADTVSPSTEAASAEAAQQQPKDTETATNEAEEPAKEDDGKEPAAEGLSTDAKEDLVNKAGKKILDKWASAKKIIGNRLTNTINKKKLKGYYVMVEAESLSPSHNPLDGFKKTEGFPEDKNGNTVNDRDYENDSNEQTGVVSLSTNYTGEALTNMPIIAKDSGIPYSGNKRTMAGQLAARNGTDSDYIDSLKENLSIYGFDEEDLAQFTHPRVVFMLDESLPYDAETFALFNKRAEYAQGSVATMVKLGKIIDQTTFNRLMVAISSYETIGEVWADKAVVGQIVSILQNSGLITEADFILYVDNGELTESGKDLISGALVGKVLEGREDAVKAINDPDTKTLATSVVTALPQIAINQTLNENSILGYIADAIVLAHDARKKGVSGNMPITTHLRQTTIRYDEEEDSVLHPAVIAIGTFIHSNKTSYLREFLKKYNKYYIENDKKSVSLFDDIPQDQRLIGMLINSISELSKDIKNDKRQTEASKRMLSSLDSIKAILENELNQLQNGTGKQQSRRTGEPGKRSEATARGESEEVNATGSNGVVDGNGGVRGREEERAGAERIDAGNTATETASSATPTVKESNNPSGNTKPSSGSKTRKSLPKNATRDEAKAYFDSVFGKDSERAKRHLEIWELSNDAYKLRAVNDPEKEAERQIKLMKLCVEAGLDFIKEGFVKFADWAEEMIRVCGEKIKKYLKQTYMSMTAHVDDETFEQMDSAKTVRGFDLDSIVINDEEESDEFNDNNNDDNNETEEVLRGSRVSNSTDANRPSGNADNGGREVQHGADRGGNGEVEVAGRRDGHTPQKLDNANGSDGNGRKGTDRDRQSDTRGRNANDAAAGDGTDVGGRTDTLNGAETSEAADKADRKEKERTKADLGDKTVPYAPHNKGNANDTVIPAGMANAVYRALDEVAATHGGDIDSFVSRELGYKDTEELYRHLNGEQIDGVALAIHQLMQGKGFVLGDMGGIGKGRQGAAIIRWAISQGHRPIYFTKGANNFSGVLRDLYDIGSGNLKPFILNAIKRGEVTYGKSPEDTNVRYVSNPTEDEYEQFYKTGTIPEGYDFLLLTYSQLNHGDPQSIFETAKDHHVVVEKDKNGKPIYYDDRPVLISPEADIYFKKANAVRLFAMSNIAVMDESHMAAGKGNIAGFFTSILNTDSRSTEGLKGVLFMSATFAKNPAGMGMYARATNIGDANNTSGNLIGAVARGGAIMQEELSRGLTEGGQYIRRERSMEGDVRSEQGGYASEESVKRIRENYDKVITIVNNFAKFQSEYITPMLVLSPIEYAKQNGMELPDGIKETELVGSVKIVEFQNQLNALKEQLLFAAKAEGVAETAIEKLKANERVVISFESTFESPLNDIAKVGEELESTDISRLIERYLTNLFKYDVQVSTPKTRKRKYKKENESEEEKEKQFDFSARGTLSFNDLTDEAQKAYNVLLSQLRNANTGLSLSPLDLIIDKITEAGFEVGEYTNRSSRVVKYKEKKENGMVARRVPKEKVNKEELQNSFNNGNVRCLLVNKAGSTGIDLHAGKNFKNQEQRCMIYAQLFKDINDQVQMSYRVDRTNQAQRGAYFTFLSPIPAEQRLAMMYERKLKSLNANTTSDQNTGNEDLGADMLNKYGSKVVREYLLDAPEVLNSLGLEIDVVNSISDENYVAPQNDSLIKKILQTLAFAPTALQEEFLRELSERYKMYITGLNEAGENDLVSTVMKLDARTINRKLFTEGKNPGENNPFAENVLIDEVEVNVLKKPLTSKEIVKQIDRYKKTMTGETDVTNISNEDAIEMFLDRIENYYDTQKENVRKQRRESEARRANIEKSVRKAAENAETPLSEEEIERLIVTQVKAAYLDEETLVANESRGLNKIEFRKKILIDTIRKDENLFKIGKTVTIPTVLFDGGIQQFEDKRFLSTGMFLGFKCGKRSLTDSSIYAVYAVADGRRIIELPLSEINNNGKLKTIIVQSSLPYLKAERDSTTIDNWESITPSRGREIRYILTGNITQAMIDASANPALRNGKLITYTDNSGNVKHGFLLPVTFDAKAFRPKGSVSDRIDDIMNDHQIEISFGGEMLGHIRKALNIDVKKIESSPLEDRPVVVSFENKAQITQEIRRVINSYIAANDFKYKTYTYKKGEHKYILDGDIDSLNNLLAELSGIGIEADSKLAEWSFDENGKPFDENGKPAKQPKRKPANIASIVRNTNNKESQQPSADKGILDLSKPMILEDFKRFFYANNKDENLNRLFDIVYKAADKLGLGLSTFYMKTDRQGGLVMAKFSPYSNSIEINTNPAGWLSRDKDMQSRIILHEMIHSVTSYVLHIVVIKRKCDSRNVRIPWGIRRVFDMLTPEQIDAAERLKNIYENATRNPVWETITDINDKYGLTNENEMVAELSNPVFRGALQSIGLWKKTINNVARLLRFVTPKTHGKEFAEKDAEIKKKAGFTETESLTETELNVERLIRSLDIPTYEAYLTAAKMQQAREDDAHLLDTMLQPKNITIKPGETLSSFNERVKKAFKAGEILRKHHLDAANEMNLLKGTENANTIGLISNFLFDRFEQGGVPMWFETQESAQEAVEQNEGAEFSRVTNEKVIKKLESEPTIKVYRAMQLIDGKLYPPMSAIMPDGTMREASQLGAWEQAEENPELADEKGYFKLDKGNKTSVPARYNPYFHTSLTALNDQFASAQDRPNLVTVEMEIPASELTSGYKADKAKDSVGKLEWKAGVVQSKLSGTRAVILTRWAKPVRIVPDSEVAASIKEMFGDKNIVMPSNVVTPSLRKELEKLGVPFVETDNRGKIVDGKLKGMTYSKALREFSKEISPYRLSDGTVYGWASADGIHLTMDGIRPETMIHEYGHLWLAAMKENNPALYESLMRLAKDSPLWKEVTSDPAYKELDNDDAILSEVFSRFSGTEGEKKMIATTREAIQNGADFKDMAAMAGWYSRLAKKLDKAWGWTLRYLDQDPTDFESMAEAADMMLKDIISGSNPNGGGYKPNGRLKTPKNGNPFFNSINEYSRGGKASHPSDIASDEYERRIATATAIFEESWVDYLNSVRILQESLIKQTGNKIHDYENVYLHMMHLSSVNRAEQDKVWASHIEPMIDAMNNILIPIVREYRNNGESARSARQKAMDELEKYLIATHGLERNKVLARRDAKAKADSEFYMRIKEAEKLLRKAQADFAQGRVSADVVQAAQDNLNQIEQERQKREDDIYARNRQKDYSGFTETFGIAGTSYTNTELEKLAKDYANDFESKVNDANEINELWRTINAVNGYTLKKTLDSGNMSRDTYNRLMGQYKNYVPLRGWNDTTADEIYEYSSEGDRSMPQNPNKTAKGRKSRAGDIIATIIAINSSAILTGNKNLAKQKLLNLIQNNKTNLTAVSNTWYVQLPDGSWEPSYPTNAAGEPLTDPDAIADWEDDMKKLREEGTARMGHDRFSLGMPIVRWQEKEHQIRVNRNGREYVIYINGAPNAAQAINGLLNMDASKSDSLEKWMRPVNRFMAKSFTSRNPLFLLRNFEKDVVSAATVGGIKFGSGYVGRLTANVARLLPGLSYASKSTYSLGNLKDVLERGTYGMYNLIRKYKEGRLDPNNEVEKYFSEFMENGGHTGYSNLYNVEESSKIIRDKVKRANSKVLAQAASERLDLLGAWWDDINSMFEDITRFATFMSSRQSGRTILESVADAKDASVNFNKKGSGKYGNRLARDLFIFINPAIQGVSRYTYLLLNKDISGKGKDDMLKNNRTARAMAGFSMLISLGVMATLAGYYTALLQGGDGDDDKVFGKKGLGNDYWKLSTFKRRNTINIPCSDGYIPINLTPEEALPYSIGAILTEHALGYGHTDQVIPEVIGQLSRISPFGSIDPTKWNTVSDMGKEVFKNVLPSAAVPFWEIYDNKNFMGSQIHGYGNTLKKGSPIWQENLQQKIDNATNRRLGAYGNINNIEHIAKSYLGGLAEFPILIRNCFEYAFTDNPVNLNETPAKIFWNSIQNEWSQKSAMMSEFQYYKAKVDWVEELLKANGNTTNKQQDNYVIDNLEENPDYIYWQIFRQYEKQYNSRKVKDKTDIIKDLIRDWRKADGL